MENGEWRMTDKSLGNRMRCEGVHAPTSLTADAH